MDERSHPAQTLSGRDAWVALAAAGIALATAAGLFARNRFFYHDDAFISLRYAANLLEHGQLVWNRGEFVEGFTNLLHVLAVAGVGALGTPLVTASRVVNLASYLALVAGLAWWTRAHLGALPAAAGMVLVAAHASLVVWVLGGLEAPLLAALVFAGHAAVLSAKDRADPSRGALLAGAAFGLAALTRPDAALFAPVAALALWRLASDRRAGARGAASLLAVVAVVVGLVTLWRLAYYGDPLPNTFYAKATGVPARPDWLGLRYLGLFLTAPPWTALLGLAGALAALRGTRRGDAVFLAASIAVYASYVAASGGDHMPAHRLLVPLVPLLALLVALGVEALPTPSARRAGLAVATLAGVAQLALLPPRLMDTAAFVGSRVGEHIAGAWPAGSLVALNTAGSIPFSSLEHDFIDMLGLNDPTIARREIERLRTPWQLLPGHAKGDGVYVLSRQPDYLILGTAEGKPARSPLFLSDFEIAESPELARCYALRRVEIAYDPALAERAEPRPNPLPFTYYERTCPVDPARRPPHLR